MNRNERTKCFPYTARKICLATTICHRLRFVLAIVLMLSAAQTFGGYPNNMKDDDDEMGAQIAAAANPGISTWQVSEPYLNLWIYNQALLYQNSSGKTLGFAVTFKQRNARSNSKIFSLGPSWECSWLSYVEYSINRSYSPPQITVGATYMPLGGRRDYVADGATKEFKSGSTMSKTMDGSGNPTSFQINLPNGGKLIYAYFLNVSDNENYAFLTQQVDPEGHTNQFGYDTTGGVVRLRSMIDSDSRTNTLLYGSTYPSQIIEVDTHYGDKATFGYDGSGRLSTVTNVVNLVDSYQYDSVGLVTNITRPYGSVSFKTITNAFSPYNLGGTNQVNRSVEVTQADGTKQLYLYRDQSTKLNPNSSTDLIPYSYSSSDVPNTSPLSNTFDNTWMDARNSFSWSAQQYASLSSTFRSSGNFNDLTVNDYKIATLNHWLRGTNDTAVVTESLSLLRNASPDGAADGQKVWLDYAGKANLGSGNWGTRGINSRPLFDAVVLPDTTTRYAYFERNQWEKPIRIVTTYTTSGGSTGTRTNNFVFTSDGIDITEFRGPGNELLSSNLYSSFHQVITHFNAVNDETDYTYDSANRVTSIHLATGLTTTNYFYTSGAHIGWLQTTIDYENSLSTSLRTNSFSYTKGLVTTSTDERGLSTTYTWDALQRILTRTIPAGSYTYQYDKLNLSNAIDALAYTNRFLCNSMGRICHVIDPANKTNRIGYARDLVTSVTNALQQINTLNYDLNGNQTSVIFPDTSSIFYAYDLLGRVTKVTDASNITITNSYNNQGLLTASSNAFAQTLLQKYDISDRITEITDSRGVRVTQVFDNLGRIVTRSYPDGGVEQFQYSSRGLIAYTNQLGFVTRYGYDALGRRVTQTNANNEANLFAYSAAGDLLSFTDGRNQVTQWGYDQYGRVTNKIDATGTTILKLKYDATGRMTNRWSFAKGDTYYSYDKSGNLTNVDYPTSADVSFTYDSANQLTKMVDAAGTTTFAYTSFGAINSEDGPWGDDTISYGYLTNHLRAGFTVLQPNSSAWTQNYSYDNANRLYTIASPVGTFTYGYSSGVGSANCGSSLIKKILLANSAYITNTFDSVGRLLSTKLRTSADADLNSHTYIYNLGGQRTRQTRLDSSYVDYTFDNISQTRTATGHESGGSLRLHEQMSYGYDAAGNLNARTNNALVQTFGVDARNRLSSLTRAGSSTLTVAGTTTSAASSVTVNSSSASIYADNTFAKDGLSLVDGQNTYTAVAQDSYGRSDTSSITMNLPASISFQNDGDGNLTSDGQRSFSYDDEDRLSSVSVANNWRTDFTYDGFGRLRVRSEYTWNIYSWAWVKVKDVRYVYDESCVVQERDGNNTPLVFYTRGTDLSGGLSGAGGIGGLLAMTLSPAVNPQHYFYHADGNGNVTAMADASQRIVARYLYDPYGRMLAASGSMADINVYRFSSKETHENSGLILYGFRCYDPTLQRWLNGDPLREGGGINLYQAMGNDALNRVDPWGLADTWWDETAEYWGKRADRSKKYLYENTPVWVGTVGGTVLDLANSIPSFPAAVANIGTGTGTFVANPTLENSAGMFSDVSMSITLVLPAVPKAPPVPKVETTPQVVTSKPSAPVPPVAGVVTTPKPTPAQPLFRAVTAEELASIQATGKFSVVPGSSTPIPGVQGKYFYGSLEDALSWAKKTVDIDGGPLYIVTTKVPGSVKPASISSKWVDGIENPNMFYKLGDLTSPIKVLPGRIH